MVESADPCKINGGRSHSRAYRCIRLHRTAPAGGEQSLFNERVLMNTDRIVFAATALHRWPTASIVIVAALIASLVPIPSQALMVGVTPNSVPDTSLDPLSATYNSHWGGAGKGPTGWANAGKNGSLNGVYIGDSWILTAHHTGVNEFYSFNGPAIQPIPGSDYQIPNVPGSGLAPGADLRLYRIAGVPSGMSPITIASQPPLLNGQTGGEVVFMGNGLLCASTESRFNIDTSTNPDTWTDVTTNPGPPPGDKRGYWPDNVGKRWGTNRIEDDQTVFGISENDPNHTVNVNNSSISYVTLYNQTGGTPYETQAVGGDSGGGVFFNRNQGTQLPPQWELAGITINNFIFDGQSTGSFNPGNSLAVYGNAVAFVDLSSYYSQVMSYINTHQDYSLVADLNLDGVAGTPADISAFVAGWGCGTSARPDCLGTGQGSVISWMNGDLTHDGKTDVTDFLRMRSGLNAGAGARTDRAHERLHLRQHPRAIDCDVSCWPRHPLRIACPLPPPAACRLADSAALDLSLRAMPRQVS